MILKWILIESLLIMMLRVIMYWDLDSMEMIKINLMKLKKLQKIQINMKI